MAQGRSSDDATLLGRAAAGDESAWRVLVERYERLVYAVALRTGLDREIVGDVYQEVWTELFRSAARIRDPQSLPKWLTVCTRRIAYKHARAASKQLESVREEMVDPAALPHEEMEALEARQQLEQGLSRLGDPCAQLLRLLFLQPRKVPYKEIARRVGIAVGSIGPIRARCLERLRKLMEGDA